MKRKLCFDCLYSNDVGYIVPDSKPYFENIVGSSQPLWVATKRYSCQKKILLSNYGDCLRKN